ncbi:hypothetical protein ElyMa_006036100 [Elysia marginata]|uniref:Uncharacterized protein n=1 Tax=Elysia marginata TaxID=1093978 RepID=A0AAV4GKE5_9GAST|nr:hypothetical protein ElyMa_006036100 [Elysia marginata]
MGAVVQLSISCSRAWSCAKRCQAPWVLSGVSTCLLINFCENCFEWTSPYMHFTMETPRTEPELEHSRLSLRVILGPSIPYCEAGEAPDISLPVKVSSSSRSASEPDPSHANYDIV